MQSKHGTCHRDRKQRLATCTQWPREPPLGENPDMKSVQDFERLGWVQAMRKLEGIGNMPAMAPSAITPGPDAGANRKMAAAKP